MKTITVITESYVQIDDDSTYEEAAGIVRDALATAPAIYLVREQRESVLLSK